MIFMAPPLPAAASAAAPAEEYKSRNDARSQSGRAVHAQVRESAGDARGLPNASRKNRGRTRSTGVLQVADS
jgi:hypothetical protein